MESRASVFVRGTSLKISSIIGLTVLCGCGTPHFLDGRGQPSDGDLVSTIKALQAVHGPPLDGDVTTLLAPPIEYDYNRDGRKEILLLVSDRGLGELGVKGVADLRMGITVAGFILFTNIEGKWWPVFYFYDHERAFLHLDTIYGPYWEDEKARRFWTEGLVVDTDKGGHKLTWFWHPAYPDWPYAFWATSLRHWNDDLNAYTGLRRGGLGAIYVVYGGK